jgi:hypothetical protein
MNISREDFRKLNLSQRDIIYIQQIYSTILNIYIRGFLRYTVRLVQPVEKDSYVIEKDLYVRI